MACLIPLRLTLIGRVLWKLFVIVGKFVALKGYNQVRVSNKE